MLTPIVFGPRILRASFSPIPPPQPEQRGEPPVMRSVPGKSLIDLISGMGMGKAALPILLSIQGAGIIFHMENNITHDGKPKPRKVDVFKKIKDNIQSLTKYKPQ